MKRIVISPSTLKRRSHWIIVSLICASLCCWQDNVIPFQMLIQALLAATLIMYLGVYQKPPGQLMNIELSASGQWRHLQEQYAATQWQIDHHSRITPWLIWVSLSDAHCLQRKTVLVYRDAVSESDYRAICRIVQRMRTQ
jgi:hypothetical protein